MSPVGSGRTPTHDLREIFNAILYVNRTGIAWRYLPHDFPPHPTVYGYFAAWSEEGILTALNYQLTGLSVTTTAAPPHPPHPSWTAKASEIHQRPTVHTAHRRWKVHCPS